MDLQLESPFAWYLRASSFQQEEDSHERQLEIIKRFLLDNRLTVAKENQFSDFRARDESAFGKGFQALLARVRQRQIKTVIVSNLDRWGAADVDEFFEFRSILLKNGCKLWSVEDGDLTSREMVQVITIIVKAEQSREYVRRMSKTIASGKAMKAALGHVQGGKASPFGFDKICFDGKGRALWLLHFETTTKKLQFVVEADGTPDFTRPPKIWEGKRQRPPKSKTDYILLVPSREMYGDYRCIDGDRVETVQTIYKHLIDKPWSLQKTARTITEMGRTIYGHGFRAQHVQKLVPNEKYKGAMTYNKTCRAKYSRAVNGQVKEVTPVRTRSGKLKRIDCPKEEWSITPEAHTGLVDADTWEAANKWLREKCRKRRPNSTEFYLSPLLYCSHCKKGMFGRMQQRTGPKKTKVRYPGYFCGSYKDEHKFEQVHSHWIPHSTVEEWLFQKLGEIGIEVDTAHEVKALIDLHTQYTQQRDESWDFLLRGLDEYLAEAQEFCTKHGITDKELRKYLSLAARHPDWDFQEKGLHELYSEARTLIQDIDARKVQAAKNLLEEQKRRHERATRRFIDAEDQLTQKVIQDEIARLIEEIKALEPECVPFVERYQAKVQELKDFRDRLQKLLKVVEEASIDSKAQRLAESIERIELHFLPYKKWQRNRLDTEKSRIIFRDSFASNDPFA